MFSSRLNHTSEIGNRAGLRWCVTGQPRLGFRYTLRVHTAATINASCTEVSSRRTSRSGSHVLVRNSPVDCGHATDAYPPGTAVHQKPSPLARAVAASRDPGAVSRMSAVPDIECVNPVSSPRCSLCSLLPTAPAVSCCLAPGRPSA